jgi:outer membrane protein W
MRKKLSWMMGGSLVLAGFMGPSLFAQDTPPPPPAETHETHEVHESDNVSHFKIYAGPAYVAPLSDSDITFGGVTDSLENENHVGWNVGIEGRFNKLIGIELDYVNADQDVKFGGSTIGDTTFSPLTATLNFHLIHKKVFDLYLGPSYTYVNWGDIHVNANSSGVTGGSTVGTDSSHGWGVSLGIDSGWEHFFFTGGLKYLNADLDLNNGQTADQKPLVARLGVGWRF